MGLIQSYKQFYLKNHAILLWIPIIVTIIALFLIFQHYQTTGDIMNKDVSLKGGITATIYQPQAFNIQNIEQQLQQTFGDVDVKQLAEFGSELPIGIIVETTSSDEELLKKSLETALTIELTDDNYSVEVVGSSLGESFYQQMVIAILVAFLFMGIVVLIIFRSFIPSIAVIGATFADIVITLAIVNIIAVTALIIGYIISTSSTIKEMFLIMFIGLLVDAFYTYWTNSSILLWYARRR